ncbi:MAG TPA: sialidase family protein [Anaerolineae bacterium]|nr:sialidase family protein [Anaerolineae bacterium]
MSFNAAGLRRYWFPLALVIAGLVAGAALGYALARPSADLPGKAKPISPDASSAEQFVVADAPAPSQLAEGFDSERLWSGHNDWEPALAADPSSSYVYQLTTRYDGPAPCNRCAGPWIIFRRSSDGGATWESDQVLTAFRKSHNDPQIEVAADGAIYVAWLHDYVPGVKFIRSTDHGTTWSTPIAIAAGAKPPSWSDKPILAISPDGRHVYIGFNASDAYVVASHDYGATFSKPIKTNNDKRYWFHSGGAVAPNGNVYFAATDYSQDYTGNAHINVIRSTDDGAVWTTTRIDMSREAPECSWSPGCYLGFFGPSAALAIDRAGTIMIAYNAGDTSGGPQRLYVRTSTDGRHWSARQELSNGSAGVKNAFPALAAGPAAGDFRLAWQDDRKGSTNAWNTWYRRTKNGGAVWNSAQRLSDLGSGAPYKAAAGYTFPYGDYFEIAVDAAGVAHVIWGEGESFTGPGGTWYTRGR